MPNIFDEVLQEQGSRQRNVFDDALDEINSKPETVGQIPDLELLDAQIASQGAPSTVRSTTAGGPRIQVGGGPPPFQALFDKDVGDIAFAPLDPTPKINVVGLMPEPTPQDTFTTAALKTVGQGAASLPDFMSSDAGVFTAALSAVPGMKKYVGAYWAQDMLRSAYAQAKDTHANWDRMNDSQKGAAVANAILTAGMGIMSAGLGFLPARRTVSPAALGETVAAIPKGPEGAATAIQVLQQAKTPLPQPAPIPPLIPIIPRREETPASQAVLTAGQAPALAAEAMKAGVAERLDAGKAAPGKASAAASERAQSAVDAGGRKVEDYVEPEPTDVVVRQSEFTPAGPVPEKPTGPATVPATPATATVAPAGEISKEAQTLLNDPKFVADAKAMETRDHPELAAKHPDAMDQIPVDEIKDDPAGYKKAVEQFKEEQPAPTAKESLTVEQPAAKPKEPWEMTPDEAVKNGIDRGDYARAVDDAFRNEKITEAEWKARNENDASKWPSVKVGDDVYVSLWRDAGKVTDVGYGWVEVMDRSGKKGRQPADIELLSDYQKRHPDLKPAAVAVEKQTRGTIDFETFDEPTGEWQKQSRSILVSKSTIEGDKPWRATVFAGPKDDPVAIAHIQLDKPSDVFGKKAIDDLSEQLGRYTRKIKISGQEPKRMETSRESAATRPAPGSPSGTGAPESTTKIGGTKNAIQEPSAKGVHVRETPADSEAVAQGKRPPEGAAKTSQQTPPAKARDVVLIRSEWKPGMVSDIAESQIAEELSNKYNTPPIIYEITARKKAIDKAIKSGKRYEPYRHDTSSQNQWAVADSRTGTRAETPIVFDHPSLGKIKTYRGFFKTKKEAQQGASNLESLMSEIRKEATHETSNKQQDVPRDQQDVIQPSPIPAAQAQVSKVARTEGVTGLTSAESQRLAALTDKLESGKPLTASEQKRFRQLRDKATPPEAEQKGVEAGTVHEGPGATMAGAPAAGGKSQIEQLADAFANKAPARARAAQLIRESFDFGSRFGSGKDLISRALAGLKSTGEAAWAALTKFDKPDDLLKAKGDLSAELETRGWRVRQFAKAVTKAIPDKRRRAAIAKWIDAGGDDAQLQLGEAATKPEFKQVYRDARNLTPDEKIAAQNISNYFESRLQEAIDAGVLEHGLEDYIHRIYTKDSAVKQRALAYVQSGILSKNPSLAKKRFYEFDYEAEAAGLRPVQDFLTRLTDYETSLSKAIAARKFIQTIATMTAPDGRPIVGIKGVGIPVEDPAGVRTGTVIKPLGDFKKNMTPGTPDYRGDYETKEYSALSRWKWVGEDSDGKPIFMQGPVAIHPDFVARMEALLEPSHVRFGKNKRLSQIGRSALSTSSAFKQTMLSLSGFHHVQIAVHALEHRVMPWHVVKDIDFANPKVEGLLKGGVTLGGEYHAPSYGEGLFGTALTHHVPILGKLAEGYQNWLFQSFIPRVKMTMALDALERNRTRYEKELASGRMTETDLNYLTAKQANAAFGELNYIMLERNKTIQDIARLALLAPDFLEARGRFAAQALTKYGAEQRVALALGAVTLYVLARLGNKTIDDQWHLEPENAFSIVYGNHRYSLRTVQGDILHLLNSPVKFWLNRLNPVFGRTLLQGIAQRDVFGRKRTPLETLGDTAKNILPISLRSSREQKLLESMANAFGLVAQHWNDVDKAFKLAADWKSKNGIQERGEFIYDPDKDPLRPLKLALNDGDDAAAAAEIKKLFQNKVIPKQKLDDYFVRFAKMPFTGSVGNDKRFWNGLSEDDKATVENARKHRFRIGMAYRSAMSKYIQSVRQSQ